jgi:hypothetical protein
MKEQSYKMLSPGVPTGTFLYKKKHLFMTVIVSFVTQTVNLSLPKGLPKLVEGLCCPPWVDQQLSVNRTVADPVKAPHQPA